MMTRTRSLFWPADAAVLVVLSGQTTPLAPGASVDIGFQAAHTGDAATPRSLTLNGTTCAVT